MRTLPLMIFGIAILTSCGDCGAPSGSTDDAGCADCRVAPDASEMDAGPDLPVLRDCWVGPDGGFCQTDYCTVTAEPGAFANFVQIELSEGIPPRAIAEDVVGGRTCVLGEIAEAPLMPFTLSVRYDADEVPDGFDEDELIGAILDPAFRSSPAAHDTTRDEFVFTVDGPTEAAVSAIPSAPEFAGELGANDFAVDDAATFARNLSQFPFGAASFDGTRFYVASGPRVLIWKDGVPDDPTTLPDVVLGRPDLASQLDLTSASNFSDDVRGIWSDGQRLAVAEGHRVLVWNQVPEQSYAPADLVLGQPDFTSDRANRGGAVSARSINVVDQIWSDGQRLIVSDAQNNRFLIWSEFPVLNDQPADLVVGQQDFTSSARSTGAFPVYRARGVYSNGTQIALGSTYACNCVAMFEAFPTGLNAAEDYRIGESGGSRVSATSYNLPGALSGFGTDGVTMRNGYRVSAWPTFPALDENAAPLTFGRADEVLGAPYGRTTAATLVSVSPDGDVWANDEMMFAADGRRLLVWKTLPTHDFQQADLVFGQPSAATNVPAVDYRGMSSRTLAQPADVSIAGDVIVVADRANNRVLLLRGALGASPDVVILGQLTGTEFMPNRDWSSPSASTMNLPAGVFTDGEVLIVADSGNHRVLVWNELPTTNGQAADVVLGQSDFASVRQNSGAGDADGDGDADATAGSMHFPSGVAYDGRLFVTDTFNHRVLVWDQLPAVNGAAANAVIGQADLVDNDPNAGLGWYARTSQTLARPVSVDLGADGRVAVSDSENNRVLIFDDFQEASVILGQQDGEEDFSPNWLSGFNVGWPAGETRYVTNAASLRRPSAVRWTAAGLVVADTENHRVIGYEGALSTGMDATLLWGQADFESREPNSGGLGGAAVRAPEGVAEAASGIVVADTQNHRLLGLGDETVFGQAGVGRNGINGSAPARGRVEKPAGLSVTKDTLWVADQDHHRVMALRGDEIVQLLGQPDDGGALPNAGGEASGWSLASPTDVWTDGNQLIVADSDNHRVLIWNSLPATSTTPADVVVGQPDLVSASPNAGRGTAGVASDGFVSPRGVLVDGGVLYVADTGNNRVAVFDTIPTGNGAAADRVWCQPDDASNLPNQGAGAPGPTTCAGPTDLLGIDGRIFVADSLNHRVVEFTAADATGAAAARVQGQPDFETRQPFGPNGEADAATFASPSSLAWDGTNFYVVDRGHHRVLIYDTVPAADAQPANRVLGQPGFAVTTPNTTREGLDSPAGIAVLPLPYRSTRVCVSDSGRDRVVVFERVARPF